MKRSFFFALAGLAAAAAVQAQVTVAEPWVRATVAQQKATGFFARLQAAKDARLVDASSPLSSIVEVHEMKLQDNVMKMRQVPALELPAGQTVELKPGGYHVMLLDLAQQVKAGDTVPVTLVFEGRDGQRQSVEVQAPVRALNAASGGGHGGHKH